MHKYEIINNFLDKIFNYLLFFEYNYFKRIMKPYLSYKIVIFV